MTDTPNQAATPTIDEQVEKPPTGTVSELKKSESQTDELAVELRRYWEVPAMAHFCSLFHSVFKLVDFDIEDLEEALVLDTESAASGGRSSLIVDLLIALLRGCLGRKDVTLLNYNAMLWDLLELYWVVAGLGPNPLGTGREQASFHILPLYAKVKLLHTLCELRLERADVEALTRNLTADSLRIYPLGDDDRGCTYWYFYGTRLYRDEPEPVRLKISLTGEAKKKGKKSPSTKKQSVSPKKKSPKKAGWGRRKRRRKGATASKRQKTAESTAAPSSGDEQDEEQSPEASLERTRVQKEESPASSSSGFSGFTPPTVGAAPVESRSAEEAAGVASRAPTDSSFRDLVRHIYSRDEDEEDDEQSGDAPRVPRIKLDESKVKFEELDESSGVPTPLTVATGGGESAAPSPAPAGEKTEAVKVEEASSSEAATAWEKSELLRPQAAPFRWSLVCSTIDEWQALTQKFASSTSKRERELHTILTNEFLPVIGDLFAQKEKERARKLAELTRRRASDRIELKRLKQAREAEILRDLEAQERQKQSRVEEERKLREFKLVREVRQKERDRDRERRQLLQAKSKDERARRLELRKHRQELIMMGEEVPAELMQSAATERDRELDELEQEIELDHQYGQLEKIVDQLKANEDAWPFTEPVSEEIAPDYHEVVEHPMDISTIEMKLLERQYKRKRDFVQDINLMLCNCLQYNGVFSEYTKVAQRLERVFIKAWKKAFPATHIQELDDAQRDEEIACIQELGKLDRQIKRAILKRADEEDEAQSSEQSETPACVTPPQRRLLSGGGGPGPYRPRGQMAPVTPPVRSWAPPPARAVWPQMVRVSGAGVASGGELQQFLQRQQAQMHVGMQRPAIMSGAQPRFRTLTLAPASALAQQQVQPPPARPPSIVIERGSQGNLTRIVLQNMPAGTSNRFQRPEVAGRVVALVGNKPTPAASQPPRAATTVIPMANGRQFLQKNPDGEMFLLEKDERGHLVQIGKVTVGAPPQGATAAVTTAPTQVRYVSAASTPAQAAKPVCSVAPVRQQPSVQAYQGGTVSSALYNPMAQTQQAQRFVFVQAPSVMFSSESAPATTQETHATAPVPGGHSYAYVFGPQAGGAQQPQQQFYRFSTPSTSQAPVQVIQVVPQIVVNTGGGGGPSLQQMPAQLETGSTCGGATGEETNEGENAS